MKIEENMSTDLLRTEWTAALRKIAEIIILQLFELF